MAMPKGGKLPGGVEGLPFDEKHPTVVEFLKKLATTGTTIKQVCKALDIPHTPQELQQLLNMWAKYEGWRLYFLKRWLSFQARVSLASWPELEKALDQVPEVWLEDRGFKGCSV